MEQHIKTAEETLLAPGDLSAGKLTAALQAEMQGLDWGDIYSERAVRESWHLEEGIVRGGDYSSKSGIGFRAVCGETTAYVSSDIISPATLTHLKEAAQAAKTHGGALTQKNAGGGSAGGGATAPRFGTRPPTMADKEKIALLHHADSICRQDARVENVLVSLAGGHTIMLVARADGGLAADYRPMVRFGVQVIMRDKNGQRETGNAGGGGRFGYEQFSCARVEELCRLALADAAARLVAAPAPAGRMPVVLGAGWAGVLLHEAVGHGLEGDFNRKGLSAFCGKVGQKVAADGVTVIDAGNIDARRGSLSTDDEGTPTRETVLIENGILRGYMQDINNARLMSVAPTGNGRRQSYAYPPMPRMTNTFMPAGRYAPQEVIASVQDGLYAEDFNGGEVDITNGNFVFVASKARRIKNGKLAETVKGATIIGNGPAIMPLISMAADDFSLDPGVGTCGKDGQWVPVGVGQPTVKIDGVTVGGTAAA